MSNETRDGPDFYRIGVEAPVKCCACGREGVARRLEANLHSVETWVVPPPGWFAVVGVDPDFDHAEDLACSATCVVEREKKLWPVPAGAK